MTHCGPKGGHRMHRGGCCCGQGGGFPRHFLSKEERCKKLEDYRDDLKAARSPWVRSDRNEM